MDKRPIPPFNVPHPYVFGREIPGSDECAICGWPKINKTVHCEETANE